MTDTGSVWSEVVKGLAAIAVASVTGFVAYKTGQRDAPAKIVPTSIDADPSNQQSPSLNKEKPIKDTKESAENTESQDKELAKLIREKTAGEYKNKEYLVEIARLKKDIAEKPGSMGVAYGASTRPSNVNPKQCQASIASALAENVPGVTLEGVNTINIVWKDAKTAVWCTKEQGIFTVSYEATAVGADERATKYVTSLIDQVYP